MVSFLLKINNKIRIVSTVYMKTWKEYFEKERQKCLESFDEFRKYTKTKTKSDWEIMLETIENVKDTDMKELLTEKEKFSQVETMDPAYQWMMHYTKYDDGQFTIKFSFTLDELEERKLLKTETCIKDEKKKYFENLLHNAGNCIVEAGKKGKKFKPSENEPTYTANNKKYKFFINLEPERWLFDVFANTKEDCLQCIKDVFESWNDKLDIELGSFDDNITKWIEDKISQFKNTIF